MQIEFTVPGVPAPGGSKRAFMRPGMRYPVITDACKRNKPWRDSVASFAATAMQGIPLARGAVQMQLTFYMPRPKSHFGKNGLKEKFRKLPHTKKPDTTKLVRALEDALTGIVWADDSQIVSQIATKEFGTGYTGARVSIQACDEKEQVF